MRREPKEPAEPVEAPRAVPPWVARYAGKSWCRHPRYAPCSNTRFAGFESASARLLGQKSPLSWRGAGRPICLRDGERVVSWLRGVESLPIALGHKEGANLSRPHFRHRQAPLTAGAASRAPCGCVASGIAVSVWADEFDGFEVAPPSLAGRHANWFMSE